MIDRKEYLRQYYLRNKERIATKRKGYYEENKEYFREKANEYYQGHKPTMISNAAVRSRQYRTRNMDYVDKYLAENPCVDCGYTNIIALEFDHVRGEKQCCVMDIVHAGYSIKMLQEEMDKCEVRCANCHKIVTYERYLASKVT